VLGSPRTRLALTSSGRAAKSRCPQSAAWLFLARNSFLWGGAGAGVVSCGSRLVHTPIALNILAGTIILASFHP
jgi:hypothetical protein